MQMMRMMKNTTASKDFIMMYNPEILSGCAQDLKENIILLG